ncbi:hypothetical protein [Micromonospora inositola]|uniref:Uncharacterized protein n=1 Tax=Micromonospora inositola TaxID=47865 RepID=A0A1C5GN36_9ACTN|nr:hypothetical protein [Micromonospora inositola]SCG34977.1 hypothetical protein GA0070613_0125 [Micromonospora inositola]
MSQPPTGPEGHPRAYPPQPPAGGVYGNPYGAGQPAPQQYGPAQPDPTLPQPVQPASAPPAPGQYAPGSAPVSGPTYPQPFSAPPMSAPPVSGPGFGQPMSAPPGSVPPYGAPAGGAGKGRTTLILAVVAGLLFVLGGVMTGLFVTKNSELNRTEKKLSAQVSERDGTIAANKQEMEKLKTDLQSVRDKLADTEQDLTGTKNDRDEQARQKKVIATCLDKLTQAMAAASAGNRAAFEKASKGLDKICDEAENYL